MMELNRFRTTSIYFIEGKNFFIFWKNNNNSLKLKFSTNFIAQNTNKWILFFHESDISLETLNESKLNSVVDSLNTHNAAICWVDDFGSNEFSLANLRRLILDKDIVSLHELEFEQNNSLKDFNFYFDNIEDSQLKLTSENNLGLSRNDGANFYFNINQSTTYFNKAAIGLLNETGCIMFISNFQDEKSSLNIAIPYYETIDKKFEPVVVANIFDKKHLVGCSLYAKYYPYLKSNNSNFKITHPTIGQQIKSNILDLDSNNLHTDEIANIEFSFSKIVHVEDKPLYNRYILSPTDGQINTSSPNSLTGYSGTESLETNSVDNLIIKFSKTKFFKVPEIKTETLGFEEVEALSLEKHNDLSEAGYWSFVKKAKYNIDAQQSPQFSNIKKPIIGSAIEIDYSPIKMADVIEFASFLDELNPPLPIIPTLAFAKNPRLVKLENVFSKIRLQELSKSGVVSSPGLLESDKKYVTPQGFLRDGTTIDFVKSNGALFNAKGVTLNSDFNLSLSKEDVFFVLEPSMMKDKPEKVNVNFKIGTSAFSVVLDVFNNFSTSAGAKDTYIIFKFSRHSFSDLLNEPTKWSNYNSYKPSDYSALIKSIKEKTTFTDNVDGDYTYLNNTILSDPNWNGVVILNIPISDQMPDVFKGLAASQDKEANPTPDNNAQGNILQLKTGLKFQYVAFPVNKTKIENGSIVIASTSFYGIIDYDLIGKDNNHKEGDDYFEVCKHFTYEKAKIENRFLLTKLLVRFANSSIVNFKSYAFWQVPQIFDNSVEFGKFPISHKPQNPEGEEKPNLIRLEGNYQKTNGGDEFNFRAQGELNIKFEDKNILDNIKVSKIGFSYSKGEDKFRFDIDASAGLGSWSNFEIISIKKLEFQNIGFNFKIDTEDFKLPKLDFDLSRLLAFPEIDFDGNGFLSSFPIKFSHFQNFKLNLGGSAGNWKLEFPKNDFFNIKFTRPNIPQIDINNIPNLFSFIFDFDLGTLGDLGGLKALKGQILIGWSLKGGFALGFKLEGPSSTGLHLDLFGAVKLDIEKVDLCSFKQKNQSGNEITTYFLKLINARLNIFGVNFPSKDPESDFYFDFNGIIYASPGSKIAWFIAATKPKEPNKPADPTILKLGFGQRVGLKNPKKYTKVDECITDITQIFQTNLHPCASTGSSSPVNEFYQINSNYLIASSNFLPASWPIEFSGVFNDPNLYGIHLGFKSDLLKGFSIDILYKKLSENLGVYSTEIQLPDSLRNQEIGGAFLKLPNIGIEIYTNGDWKVDIGFPRNGNDWSRSGFLQLRTAPPFVGFFGFYIMMSKVASLTLFKRYISDKYSTEKLQIIQAGFAMRVGIGFYFDKGILYVGASITVYGILEGAFAFEKQKGLAQLFPDHFAVLGRMGAIAELVGYVDFGIIKASVYISLRAEFGMLMVYIGNDHTESALKPGSFLTKGIQPVLVYIEGQVIVRVSIKIGCVKIHLSFSKTLRFEYTIGGGGPSGNSLMGFAPLALAAFTDEELIPTISIKITGIKEIPMMYLPAFSKVEEGNGLELKLIHSFMIPFFGKSTEKDENGNVKKIVLSNQNILKDKIIKPFFEDLMNQLDNVVPKIFEPRSYETIRSILVNGHAYQIKDGTKTKVKIELSLEGYIPTFIKGINSGDETSINEILKSQFLFNPDNSEHKQHDDNDNSIEGKYKEELLLIPAPISGKIKIIENGKPDVETTNEAGFKIKIAELVSGFPTDGTPINKIEYDVKTLEFIEKFYDDYKTQFLERKNADVAGFVDEIKDIRGQVIIPEFFKLIGLLTLEAFHTDTNPNRIEKGEKEYNPIIELDGNGDFIIEGKTEKWKTNDFIPQIVGQLNYFYNSGLRLPFKDKNFETKSIYNILNQEVTVTPNAAPNLSKIKIDFNGVDITSDVFRDDPAKNAMLTFINGINKFDVNELKQKLIINDTDYNPTDNPIQFTKPYRLIPVSLAVQNGKLGIENEFRFFEIPRKLLQHSGGKAKYSFEVNYAKYGDDKVAYSTQRDNTPKLIGLDKCLNVEVRIKKHSKQVLEIVNVFADDLNLMNALHSDNYPIQNIDFYYKPEANPQKQEAGISLVNLKDTKVTILKTNLSPRTSPPIFKELTAGLAENEEKKYWEDSDVADKSNFIKLVWESLTTNNGGCYLILDKEFKEQNAEGKDIIEGSIIISFAGVKAVPAYFNALKLKDSQGILAGLDSKEKDNQHYLFLDKLSMELNGSEVLVREYQPTIPAHTVGFDVYRKHDLDHEGIYHNYLPLEFSLKNGNGVEILSRDKVLPIMPSSFKDVTSGEIVEGKVKYNHLTPLVIQSSSKDKKGNLDELGRNLNRYSAVGEKYNLSINLRDVFGNRTNPDDEFLASAPYTHQYFDKLVPIESWPLIRFSYWFNNNADTTKLLFDVSCSCDILEILDLAGIAKKPIVNPSDPIDIKYEYKYKLDENQSIDLDDVIKLQAVVPGILNNLYTIYAQLNDVKTEAKINDVSTAAQKEAWKTTVEDLFKKLENLIKKNTDSKYYMPEVNVVVPANYSVEINNSFKLKTPLKIEIGLNRLESALIHTTDKDLTEPNIWDYELTKEVKTSVRALNPAGNDKSKLTDLNAAIRGTAQKYCLGISSEITQDPKNKETKSEKVIFLIREDKLCSIQAKVKANKSFEDSSYFGIKPISNSLWSGDYQPIGEELKVESFSNIDLDKSLRVVLEKIDSFLQAKSLPNEIFDIDATKAKLIKDVYNTLLKGKRSIVKKKLIGQLAGVMKGIDSNSSQQNEFRDLLLNNLTSFYAYDGMIKTEVTGLEDMEGHRFSISLKKPLASEKSQNYNLVSSKIGDKEYGNEWFILFDQKENVDENINFDFEADITHIEYDFEQVPNSEDISKSTWIQLITPVSITEKLRRKKYSVEKWQKITREFPSKPIITKHLAIQMYQDKHPDIMVWNNDTIGLWNYYLDIKDSEYVVNDIIHVDLEIKTTTVNSLADEPKFEGFIAYWATEFSKPTIDTKFHNSFIELLKMFVNDLSREFHNNSGPNALIDEEKPKWFELQKVEKLGVGNKPLKDGKGNSILHWNIVIDPTSNLIVKGSVEGKDDRLFTDLPSVIVGPFNMLQKENRVISISPKVKVYRNKGMYEKFVYETDTVMPESAATPQIQYHLPIGIKIGDKMSPIFDLIKGLNLPYKSTAKLLIGTDNLDDNREAMLPVIPLRQMEFNAGGKPAINIDEMFNKYSNGYPSISITIYNMSDDESDLPIFNANNIYKQKQ